MKSSNSLIISLLAITIISLSSAYYIISRNSVSADTLNPGFPSIPGQTGPSATATLISLPPVPAVPATIATTTPFSQNNSVNSLSTNSYSLSQNSSSIDQQTTLPSSSHASTQTTPLAYAAAAESVVPAGAITKTPLMTFTPITSSVNTSATGSNSTAWILISVAVGTIAALGYVMFRKKPLPTPPVPVAPPQATSSPNTPQQTTSPNPQPPAPTQTPPEQNINNQPPV